eukprot:c25190_g1_i2 orf=330-857(-)
MVFGGNQLMDSYYEDKFVLKYAALQQEFQELREEAHEVADYLHNVKKARDLLRAEVRLKMLTKRADTTQGIRELIVRDASTKPIRLNGAEREPAFGTITLLSAPLLKPVSAESGLKAGCEPLLVESVPQGAGALPTPARNRELVGVLKHGPNGFSYSKKAGKRKISWQDEGIVKV